MKSIIRINSRGQIYRSDLSHPPIRGKRVSFPTFEIVETPMIRISEIKLRKFSMIDYDDCVKNIGTQTQEDAKVFAALDTISSSSNE